MLEEHTSSSTKWFRLSRLKSNLIDNRVASAHDNNVIAAGGLSK